MYHFNLLPDQYKKAASHWILLKHTTNGLVLLNTIFGIALLCLFGSTMVLNTITEEATISTSTTTNNPQENAIATVQQINASMTEIQRIQNNHHNYLRLIVHITEQVPSTIAFGSVNIIYEDELITISGTAQDRESLQEFQAILEENEQLSIVTFPFDVLTQSENIPFNVELSFSAEDFDSHNTTL